MNTESEELYPHRDKVTAEEIKKLFYDTIYEWIHREYCYIGADQVYVKVDATGIMEVYDNAKEKLLGRFLFSIKVEEVKE